MGLLDFLTAGIGEDKNKQPTKSRIWIYLILVGIIILGYQFIRDPYETSLYLPQIIGGSIGFYFGYRLIFCGKKEKD